MNKENYRQLGIIMDKQKLPVSILSNFTVTLPRILKKVKRWITV